MAGFGTRRGLEMIYDHLVIGAGLSGLTLAHFLRKTQLRTVVIEKSRGLGGRMATRRLGELTFDHGAQFYTHSLQKNFFWDEEWQKKGLTQTWLQHKSQTLKNSPFGMSRLAKDLSQNQEIHLQQTVHHLEPLFSPTEGSFFRVHTLEGPFWLARSLFFSAPLPQSLDILDRSHLNYPSTLREKTYGKAVVGLFGLGPVSLDFHFMENVSAEIFSLSNQMSKGLSPQPALTVTMTSSWSHENWDLSDTELLARVEERLFHILPQISAPSIRVRDLKKWRYAQPEKPSTELFFRLGTSSIFLLGDAFGGGSLHGAVRSAEAAFLDYLSSL